MLNASGFIALSNFKSSSINQTNRNINNSESIKNNSLNSNLNMSLGFGKGRLEYVTDPIMATFLINDLIEKASVKGVSSEQIENIAKGITKIRNTRFLDFRFRVIDQIEMLDQILKENGIASEKTAKYFTTIYDNWLYATQLQRLSGNRWTFALNSNLSANNDNEDVNRFKFNNFTNHRKRKNTDYTYKNGIEINYEQSIQSSTQVQKSWGFGLIGFQSNYNSASVTEDSIGTLTFYFNSNTTKTNSLINNITLIGNWQYLFQPNTRIYLSFGVLPGISLTDSKRNDEYIFNQNITNTNQNTSSIFIDLALNYFKLEARTHSCYRYNDAETKIEKIQNPSSSVNQAITNGVLNNFRFNASINYIVF